MRWLPLLVTALLSGSALAQTVPTHPSVTPQTPPTLDGVVTPGEWPAEARIRPFTNIFNSSPVPESERTEAYLMSDGEAIYLAYVCFDSQPNTITTRERQNNTNLSSEDYVGFVFDPYASSQFSNQSEFIVNPLGTRTERIAGGRTSKVEWRGEWSAATSRGDYGYTVEIRIPWAIFDLPEPRPLSPQINLFRSQPRTRIQGVFADITLAGRGELLGRWQNVNAPQPKVRPWQGLVYISPDWDTELENDFEFRSGFDLRYRQPGGLTWLLGVNPDFRNIEQEVLDLSFSRSERFLDDARPFFVEGGDYFNLLSGFGIGQPFYSRRIDDFDYGVKAFGNFGSTRLGVLAAREDDQRTDAVINVRQILDPRSRIGAFATLREAPGQREQAFGSTGNFGRGNYSVVYDLVSLERSGQPSGSAGALGLEYSVPEFFATLKRAYSTNCYRPGLGFIGFPGSDEVYLYSEFNRTFTGGDWKRQGISVYAEASRRNGASLGRFYNAEYTIVNSADTEFEIDYDTGTFLRAPINNVSGEITWNTSDRTRRISLSYQTGIVDGEYANRWEASVSRRLARGLDLTLSYDRFNRGTLEELYIGTIGWELDPFRSLTGRLVSRDGELNTFLAFRQAGGRGLEYFLIFGDPNADRSRSRIAFKLVSAF